MVEVNRYTKSSGKLANPLCKDHRTLSPQIGYALIIHLLFLASVFLTSLFVSTAQANTYNLTSPNQPAICSGNQGTWSGSTYICNWGQPLQLAPGDVVLSNNAITIQSRNGMTVNDVVFGGNGNAITLRADGGSTITLQNSTLFGSITNTPNVSLTAGTVVHGNISTTSALTISDSTVLGTVYSGSNLTIQNSIFGDNVTSNNQLSISNSDVAGNLTSANALTATNTNVQGTITSNNGAVTLSGGEVNGLVRSNCCKVTISNGAEINAGVTAGNNGIEISDSTVTGDLNASNNPIILNNVTMLSGNISAGQNNVTISGGTINANVSNAHRIFISNQASVNGDLQARFLVDINDSVVVGDIETTDDHDGLHSVNLTDSEVYGNVTVRGDWGTINGNWPQSAIYGDCEYFSVTPSLCSAAPPPDSCESITALSEFGIIGDSQFEYGGNSTINGNPIDGEGNTPTPSGSVTTVPTEFPLFEPLQFPSNMVGGPNRTNITNIPPGGYDRIRADNNSFTSTAGGGVYYIEEIELRNGSTMQFGPGDYFIEEMDIGNNVVITVNPAGPVRLFIKDEIEGGNGIFINSTGNTANFIIYLYDDAEVDIGNSDNSPNSGDFNFNGIIYSPYEDTEIEFGNNNNIQGSIVSAGEVEVGSNTNFTYSLATQQQVLEAFDCEPEGAEILYFQVRRPGTLVSCFTAPIEVRACANASCTELFEDPAAVELTTTNATAEWANGDITSGSGTTVSTVSLTNGIGFVGLQNIPGGNSPFSISGSTPNAVNPTECFDPTGTTSGACAVDFRTAGLLFVGANNFDPVPDSHAGLDFQVALRAVETNVNTGACEARVEGVQTVNMGFECLNPNECQPDQAYTVDGTEIAFNNSGVSSNLSPVSLTFDANGIALLPHNYTDVGLLRLHASLDLPAEPNADAPDIDDPAVTLTGTSLNDFVVKPHTLVVQALNEGGSIWTATTNTGNGFQAAGSPFTVILQSLNANGDPTPNFGNEATPAGVTADFDSVAFPSGGFNGSLNFAQNFVPDAVYDGAFRSEDVTWSEAGTVNIQARLIGDDYLGAGDAFSKPPSPVGRFFPDRFTVIASSVADACTLDGFSYMNQNDILVEYTLHALNVSGARTRNYGFGGYSGSAAIAAVATNITPADEIGDSFGTRFSIVSPPDWDNGIMTFSEPNATFARRADNTPDGPFESLQIGLQVTSELDNRGFATSELSLNTQAGDAAPLSGELNLRYGRLALENIGGPEDEDLPVIMRAEYWDGTRFFINELDSCTPTVVSSLGIVNNPDNLPTTPDGITSTLENGELLFGDLLWQAANEQGEFEFEYVAPAWLQYPWEDDEGNSFDNPRAFGSFGQYRGNNRVIYWLELR